MMTMTSQRYLELSKSKTADLTPEETAEGWHFCPEWDYMPIHRTDPEMEACICDWKEGKL